MLLIGLGHKAQQGKDTFAEECKRLFGADIKIGLHSFADPLREEVRQAARACFADLCPGVEFDPQKALRLLCLTHDVEFEENAKPDVDYPWGKQRKLHQWWGTDYRRAQDPLYWVKQAAVIVDKAEAEGVDALFFRDLRFPDEYDFIGDRGGVRIKVSRLGYVSSVPQHISETALDDHLFDIQLGVRDGDLPLLQMMSAQIFIGLFAKALLDRLTSELPVEG